MSRAQHRIPDFEEVYVDNVQRIYGFLAYRLASRDEAEDLTQVVFEKALRAWVRFDPAKASESTWLITIARNVLIDHLRKRRSDDAELSEDEFELESADRPAEGVSPELARAISALRPRERTVLALRYGADLTGPELADLLGLSTANVHQILSRSLRRLRDELDERPSVD